MSFADFELALRSPIREKAASGATVAAAAPTAEPVEYANWEVLPPLARTASEDAAQAHLQNVAGVIAAGRELRGFAGLDLGESQVRIIDQKAGIVDYIASDETLDSYRECIKASGWQFNRMRKNAPFVDSHNYDTIGNQLGKVLSFGVTGGQLVERVQWAIAPEVGNELAQFGFRMTAGGFLRAVSVGFIPLQMVTKYDGNESAWIAALTSLALTPEDAARVRAIYLSQEQFELSSCIIGANGNAVAKAYKAGVLTDGDLDKLTDTGERKLSRYIAGPTTGSPSNQPADGAAKVREWSGFVRELNAGVSELRALTNRS